MFVPWIPAMVLSGPSKEIVYDVCSILKKGPIQLLSDSEVSQGWGEHSPWCKPFPNP